MLFTPRHSCDMSQPPVSLKPWCKLRCASAWICDGEWMEVPICKHLICLPTRLQSLKGWWALLVAIQRNLHDLSTGEKKTCANLCNGVEVSRRGWNIHCPVYSRPLWLEKSCLIMGLTGPFRPFRPAGNAFWRRGGRRSHLVPRCGIFPSARTCCLALGSLGGWQRFYAKSSEKQIEDNKQHQATRTKHLLSTFFQPPALLFVEWCCDATYMSVYNIYIYVYIC